MNLNITYWIICDELFMENYTIEIWGYGIYICTCIQHVFLRSNIFFIKTKKIYTFSDIYHNFETVNTLLHIREIMHEKADINVYKQSSVYNS